MKYIQTNDELVVGCSYYCREKNKPNEINVFECKAHKHAHGSEHTSDIYSKYIEANGQKIWAMDYNHQAMLRWDIVGPVPVPVMTEEIFISIMAAEYMKMNTLTTKA